MTKTLIYIPLYIFPPSFCKPTLARNYQKSWETVLRHRAATPLGRMAKRPGQLNDQLANQPTNQTTKQLTQPPNKGQTTGCTAWRGGGSQPTNQHTCTCRVHGGNGRTEPTANPPKSSLQCGIFGGAMTPLPSSPASASASPPRPTPLLNKNTLTPRPQDGHVPNPHESVNPNPKPQGGNVPNPHGS